MAAMAGSGAYESTNDGGKKLTSPRLDVSALHDLNDLTMAFNFIVTLNSFTFGFQSVSGLSVERATETRSEGGVNDHGILCGMPNTGSFTLTFKRGVLLRTSELVNKAARIAASVIPSIGTRRMRMLALASTDPQTALELGPAIGTIQVFNRERTHLRGLYSFFSLGMTSWRADDLDASNNSVWCEEITIAHTGLTRHPLQIKPNIDLTVPEETEQEQANADQETEKQNEKQEQSEAKNQQDESQKKIDKLEEENKNLNNELEELKKKLKELEEQNKKQQQQKTEKTDQEDQKSSESSEESKNTQENTQENSESSGENKNTENTNTSSSTQK